IFGSKLIIACYVAYYIKAITELLDQDPVDLSELEKVPIESFSEKVQEFLRERNLQDKVYQEKNKSKSVNAALVGWGDYERIEIYGDHDNFDKEEFESVLMHEI